MGVLRLTLFGVNGGALFAARPFDSSVSGALSDLRGEGGAAGAKEFGARESLRRRDP